MGVLPTCAQFFAHAFMLRPDCKFDKGGSAAGEERAAWSFPLLAEGQRLTKGVARKRRVLSPSSPAVLTPPIPQWGPSVARGRVPARRHPQERSLTTY
jgi:hypothetical protein